MDLEDRYIREAECHRISGLSRVTRWRLERAGKFPERRQLSDNAIGWLLSEVMAWRDARNVGMRKVIGVPKRSEAA
jgi:prophage regulatory protein